MKSKVIIEIVAAVAVLGGGYTVTRMDFIGTGKVGIVYNYKDGVQDKVLTPGMHFIAPMNKVKEFSTSNEILVLTKDKRDGSKEDDSFKVATSDDASIAVSFQMSYRYDPDTVIDTYKIELTKAEADAKKAKVKAAAEAENTKTKAKAQAEANKELSASITDELIKMKEAEAHYKNGWVTVQGADAVIADK